MNKQKQELRDVGRALVGESVTDETAICASLLMIFLLHSKTPLTRQQIGLKTRECYLPSVISRILGLLCNKGHIYYQKSGKRWVSNLKIEKGEIIRTPPPWEEWANLVEKTRGYLYANNINHHEYKCEEDQ